MSYSPEVKDGLLADSERGAVPTPVQYPDPCFMDLARLPPPMASEHVMEHAWLLFLGGAVLRRQSPF